MFLDISISPFHLGLPCYWQWGREGGGLQIPGWKTLEIFICFLIPPSPASRLRAVYNKSVSEGHLWGRKAWSPSHAWAEAGLKWIQARRVIQESLELLAYYSLNYLTQEWKVWHCAVVDRDHRVQEKFFFFKSTHTTASLRQPGKIPHSRARLIMSPRGALISSPWA